MSTTERRYRIKFKKLLGRLIKKSLGTEELVIVLEDSEEIYKKLSVSKYVESWKFEDSINSLPVIEEENCGSNLNEFELSTLILNYWIEAVNDYDKGPEQCLKEITLDAIPDFNILSLKTFLELKYNGNLKLANNEIMGKLKTKRIWDVFHDSPSVFSALSQMYK